MSAIHPQLPYVDEGHATIHTLIENVAGAKLRTGHVHVHRPFIALDEQ